MKIEKSYIICCAARTGSNLLATTLRKTKIAGQPFEYIDIYKQPSSTIRDGIPSDIKIANLADWFEYVMSTSTTANGVFGTTIHWWQLRDLFPALAARNPQNSEPAAPSVQALQSFFPNLKFIWLQRDNKVAQGISHYLAIRTGVWFLGPKTPPKSADDDEIPYNFEAIDKLVDDAMHSERCWRDFLQPVLDTTLVLTYEGLSFDLVGSVGRVIQHLDLPPIPIIAPALRKQSSARSIEWERMYREEKRALA